MRTLLVSMGLLTVACGALPTDGMDAGPDMVAGDSGSTTTAMDFAGQSTIPDMARRFDALIGRQCFQSPVDGGTAIVLGAGDTCHLGAAEVCGVPSSCNFESFDYAGFCQPTIDADGGAGPLRCCQHAKTHSQIDGSIETCRNCGDGWSCSGA